jgi:membrane fusion protein (multidrug efflux system)
MHRAATLFIIIFLSGVLFSTGCADEERGSVGGFLSKTFKKGAAGVPVTVVKARQQQHAVKVTMPGILLPSERVEVSLPNDARIERYLVNVGDYVSNGSPLFQISQQDFNIKVAQLRAEEKELQANLEKNTYFLRNRDRLLEEGRITTEQYDALEDEVDKNEDELDKVKSQLTSMEAQTGKTIINSPISGVIQSTLSSAGGVVVANRSIVTIVRNNPMIVNFRLASYETKTVSPGMEVEVRLADIPGERFKAKITSIGAELDRDSNTFPVKATVMNPRGIIKAGMNAFVELSGSRIQRYYKIPAEAVIVERRRHYVFTVVRGVAHRVRVIPRKIRGGTAEIVEGLHEGDIVVVKGQDKLAEGTVVDIWRR